jgi:uncharacterized protein (DUF302 family)
MKTDAEGCDAPRGVLALESAHSFPSTLERLIAAFHAHGIKVFALIDQQAEAAAAGIELWPATLILFGNPRAGTPLMLAQPSSGIDLPLKAFVSEVVPGKVSVSLNAAAYLIERHSLPSRLAGTFAPAERLVMDALRP